MISGSIGRRYARALLDLGQEQGKADDFLNQLLSVQSVLKSSQDISFLLNDPAFQASQRKKVFNTLAPKLGLSEAVKNFLSLLIDRERIGFFDDVVTSYQEQADDLLKRVRVQVKSASPLDKESEERLKKLVEKMTGKQAFLNTQTDASLMGGVVIKVRDMVFDGSLKNALHQLTEDMLSSNI